MELRQLRYFMAVAEAGNFSRAASNLHMSQPPLSTQVKALEDELGVRLLERTNHGATLTPAGAAFLEEARAALTRLESARRRAQLVGKGDIGMLSVGFVSIADYGVLPPALKSFRAAFPQVEVQLHELTTDAQIRELRANRLDMGIALAPVDDTELEFRRLHDEELVLALPSAYRAGRAQDAIDLRLLATESFIVPPRDIAPGLHDVIIAQCRAAGFTPRITQHARQMQTVISLVSSGMGFALVPSSVRNLNRAGVQYRRLRGKAASVELGIVTRRRENGLLVERFAEALAGAVR
ncbi:MAG TPA: LysR family transcriptional regulator [Steroidobacteraceae bacterium]|nr:LysR family transcriptional regulator [Steroidobacteraceae bacterium]